jgi:hypothetical protein
MEATATRTAKSPRKKVVSPSNRTGKKRETEKDLAESYNQFKNFEGHQYTGMKVGRSHKWYYDKGEWKESKITPDLWEISYAVTKRRAGKAPEGSGVPVGTAYHWYIVAHQNVRKLNSDDYTTTMAGLKFKLAHKRYDKDKWSTTAATQRKRLIQFLQDVIKDLQKDPIPLEIEYKGKSYKGEAMPITQTCYNGVCTKMNVTLNDEYIGTIRYLKSGWKMSGSTDQKFINAIGKAILAWYSL